MNDLSPVQALVAGLAQIERGEVRRLEFDVPLASLADLPFFLLELTQAVAKARLPLVVSEWYDCAQFIYRISITRRVDSEQ